MSPGYLCLESMAAVACKTCCVASTLRHTKTQPPRLGNCTKRWPVSLEFRRECTFQYLAFPMGSLAGNAIGFHPAPLRATLAISFWMNPLGTRCFGLAPKKATFQGFPLSGTLFHFLSTTVALQCGATHACERRETSVLNQLVLQTSAR